jgi:hypothetical protein
MRTIYYSLVTVCAFSLWSCNFSAGTKKDLATGLSYSYHGFGVDEVLLVGPDNVAQRNNEVLLNTKIAIVAQGITNYELKDGKAFPGLMLRVTDKNDHAVIDEADLFANTEGYSPADASALRGSITIGNPMKSGEEYHVTMRVWDKTKLDNELTADVDVVVK